MTEQEQPTQHRGPNRRQVITGVGAVALGAGVIAATGCSSGGEGGSPSKPPAKAGPAVEVPKAKVPVGNGVILPENYVVTQPSEGQFHAFSKTCPHSGCAVSFIKNQQIVCACHGSEFSVTDGARTAGPARSGLTPANVKETGDNLVIGG